MRSSWNEKLTLRGTSQIEAKGPYKARCRLQERTGRVCGSCHGILNEYSALLYRDSHVEAPPGGRISRRGYRFTMGDEGLEPPTSRM